METQCFYFEGPTQGVTHAPSIANQHYLIHGFFVKEVI